MIGFSCSLTKRYIAKSAKAQRENGTANTRQKNDVDLGAGGVFFAAEKRCGLTIWETDYFSNLNLTACLTRKCKDKLE